MINIGGPKKIDSAFMWTPIVQKVFFTVSLLDIAVNSTSLGVSAS